MTTTATTPATTSKVWLITGCSSGLGREIALAALARGDKVIATARNPLKLGDLRQLGAFTLALDVTFPDEQLQPIIAEAVQAYGRIDILVNNAAYVLGGAVEEVSAKELFDQFNTNVFSIFTMTRAVMPYMRAQKSGVVANIGSIAGWSSHAATGIYCTTKFAVAGVSETLRDEVKHLGIDVTCIDLGSLRTTHFRDIVYAEKTIPELEPATNPVKTRLASFHGSDAQRGDPVKCAKLIVEALTKSGRCEGRSLPNRLAIGADAVTFIGNVLDKSREELDEWADLAKTTDCAGVPQ